jgi:hypothetical protein
VFPHFDADGLCGYEIKNKGFTGFSPGHKGLWLSHEFPDDHCLVVCESAIDALSYAVLIPDDHTRFASISGKPNPRQPELITSAVARMPASSVIVAAMDADAEGRKLAEVVRESVKLVDRSDLAFELHEPNGFKDFSDRLRGKPAPLFPTASLSNLKVG